jgi:hypothetical protein
MFNSEVIGYAAWDIPVSGTPVDRWNSIADDDGSGICVSVEYTVETGNLSPELWNIAGPTSVKIARYRQERRDYVTVAIVFNYIWNVLNGLM